MSDKLQFVVAPDKLKLVGHETDPVLAAVDQRLLAKTATKPAAYITITTLRAAAC
jgi:hypothetical protein